MLPTLISRLICQGNLGHKSGIRCRYFSGFNCVCYGLKVSILVKVGDLFVTGRSA